MKQWLRYSSCEKADGGYAVADILIIHDQGKATQPLVDYLRGDGQTVVEAADLNQARSVSRSTGADFDIVLLTSPKDKSAPSPVRHAKREWPMADVIVIGGPSDLADAVDAIRNGASDFVPAGDLARTAVTGPDQVYLLVHRALFEASPARPRPVLAAPWPAGLTGVPGPQPVGRPVVSGG